MFLPVIAILSLVIALVVFFVCFMAIKKLYWIPIIYVSSFLGLSLTMFIFVAICTLFVNRKKPCRKHSPLFRFFANCIIDTTNQIMRVKVHISGKEILPKESFLLVGNHVSFMDPVITMGELRSYRMGFVGASNAIFKFPIVNNILHKCFSLPINRESARDGVKMVNEAAEIIKSQAASIGIYPEGRRNLEEDGLLPFKNGAFKIAQKAKCPIVVAVIKNTDMINKNFPFKRTHVFLDFVKVIEPSEFEGKTTQQIGDSVREIIQQAM